MYFLQINTLNQSISLLIKYKGISEEKRKKMLYKASCGPLCTPKICPYLLGLE